LTEFIELMTIEVYGRPSDKAQKQLRQKAWLPRNMQRAFSIGDPTEAVNRPDPAVGGR
jgi:hypothetical protein